MLKLPRIAHWLWRSGGYLLHWCIEAANRIFFAVVLPPSTRVSRGILLSFNGVGAVLCKRAVTEDGAMGVTIGGRSGSLAEPVIGEGVNLGSGAKVLGPVRIGGYASIGANAVVLGDAPDYDAAVAVPARVVRIGLSESRPHCKTFSKATGSCGGADE